MNRQPVQNDMPSESMSSEAERDNAHSDQRSLLQVDDIDMVGIGASDATRDAQLSDLRTTNQLLQKEVTQRKRAEEALAKRAVKALIHSDARFHAVFENAAVGIALLTLERKPIAFNAITEKIIGYSFEEIEHIDPRTLAVPEDRAG